MRQNLENVINRAMNKLKKGPQNVFMNGYFEALSEEVTFADDEYLTVAYLKLLKQVLKDLYVLMAKSYHSDVIKQLLDDLLLIIIKHEKR